MNFPTRWRGVLAGLFLALTLSTSVFAYAGQVVATLTITGPSGAVECATPLTFEATALDVDGNPIAGQPIQWSFSASPSNKDRIKPRTSKTDAAGVATTTVTLACVPGQRTLTARGDKIRASAVVTVVGGAVLGATGGVLGATGLPRTSTIEPAGVPVAPILSGLTFLALLLGSAFILRRFALARR